MRTLRALFVFGWIPALGAAQACAGDDGVTFPPGADSGAASSGTLDGAPSGSSGGGSSSSGDGGGTSSSSGVDPNACSQASDCASGVCTQGQCQQPTPSDGVKNGTETDVDCGGPAAPGCALDLACLTHTDCASTACAYTGKCIADRNCTGHGGGDTCGKGADVQAQADENVSCCAQAPLEASAVTIDRFLITAGRMRAFVERLGGDVRSYVAGLPPEKWSQDWNVLVPGDLVEANVMLGPRWVNAPNDPDGDASKRGCAAPNYNGHTYWVPTAPLTQGDRDDSYDAAQQYTQEQLDPKALNCVNWYLVKALCTWEGGRLPTHAEVRNAFTNGTGAGYPWSFADATAYDPGVQDPRLNHQYSYMMPNAVDENGALDMAAKLSPPGRFFLGYNAHGVELAGNTLEWVDDGPRKFAWTLSFEAHGSNDVLDDWGSPSAPDRDGVPNGYYAMGARCVFDH